MNVNTTSAAFYTMADERFFIGAVGLINSLRVVGHTEPVYVLDCGLTPDQRELLAGEAALVPAPRDAHPLLLKTIAPLAHPAEVMVLIDADMIVTRRLEEPIEQARGAGVVAVRHGRDRFIPEWGPATGHGVAQRRPYVSGGLILLGGETGARVLELVDGLLPRIDFERTFWRRAEPDYPFLYGDQDAWNAVLATAMPAEALVALDRRLEAIPPFAGIEVVDETMLRCRYEDGVEPYELHHYSIKPWLELTLDGVYSRLLRRLLAGDDVAIKVPRAQVPRHMRPGLIAEGIRNRAHGHGRVRSYLVEPIASRVRRA
jgi:hypothetical protein